MTRKTKNKYTKRLTDQELLDLLNSDRYIINLELGKVYGQNGELKTYCNDKAPNAWIRLFKYPSMRSLPRSHAIWMYGTQTLIPKGWQIHHEDLDPENDSFDNFVLFSSKRSPKET